MKYYLSTAHACEYVGLSLRQFARLAEDYGILPDDIGGKNFWRLPRLEQFLARRPKQMRKERKWNPPTQKAQEN